MDKQVELNYVGALVKLYYKKNQADTGRIIRFIANLDICAQRVYTYKKSLRIEKKELELEAEVVNVVFTRKLYIWVNWKLRKQLRKSTKTESRIENCQAA